MSSLSQLTLNRATTRAIAAALSLTLMLGASPVLARADTVEGLDSLSAPQEESVGEDSSLMLDEAGGPEEELLLLPEEQKMASESETQDVVEANDDETFEAEAYETEPLGAGPLFTFKTHGYVDTASCRDLLPMVNQVRRKAGLGDLVWDMELEKVAMQRAAESAYYWSHTRPDGNHYSTALPSKCTDARENISESTCESSMKTIHEGFVNSEPHYRNMVTKNMTLFAAARFIADDGYEYIVESFAAGWNGSGMTEPPVKGDRSFTITSQTSICKGLTVMAINRNMRGKANADRSDAPFVVGEEASTNVYIEAEIARYFISPVPIDPASCTLSSSNSNALTIDASGKIRAAGEGKATLTAALKANPSITGTMTNSVLGDMAQADANRFRYEGQTYLCDDDGQMGIFDYTGDPIKPSPLVSLGGYVLEEGVDYTVGFQNNIGPGTAQVTITGKGPFFGSKTMSYSIEKIDIGDVVYYARIDSPYVGYVYTGKPITPKFDFLATRNLTEGIDFEYAYKNNVQSGTATVLMTGKGLCSGSISLEFTIDEAWIGSAEVSEIRPQAYTGKPIKPKPVLTYEGVILKEGTDYTLSYEDNVNKGTAHATWTGKGNFYGSSGADFKIIEASKAKTDIAKAQIADIKNQKYTGKDIEPKVSVTIGSTVLVQDRDYTVRYSNNVEVGTALVTITGRGSYAGTVAKNFNIVEAGGANDLAQATIDQIADQPYTGKAITPEVTVRYQGRKLVADRDYTVTYKSNVKVGSRSAKVTVTGKGGFTGSKTATFSITPANLANATVAKIAEQAYTGRAAMPALTVKVGGTTLKAGTDYFVVYRNNVNKGTATAIVTGMGNYIGSKAASFKIGVGDLSKATVGKIADQAYTGSAIKPTPTIQLGGRTLVLNADYTLSYSNNTKKGTATVTATGKGNYKGTVSAQFKIMDKKDITMQEMYRLYNPNSGEHFYTAKAAERDALVKVGWVYESVGWIAPIKSRTPVYRLYNPFAGDHHYTTNATERDVLVNNHKWTYEGVGWYSDDAKGTPLYRQYNPNAVTGSHNYTTNKKENDALVKMGWIAEGIGWYGLK